jgi:hypothetical protein
VPFRVSPLLELLVIRSNIGFAVIIEGTIKQPTYQQLFVFLKTQCHVGIYLRQLPVVLQLILQRRQLLNNALSFLSLLGIGHRIHRPSQIINGASLY